MRFSTLLLGGVALAATAGPAFAQDTAPPSPITISGSAAVVSDYRLRGVSQSDKDATVQASLTIAHESGLYIATFASGLSGWGTFGGANTELDAIGGFKKSVGAATVDVGVTWYTYPGGFSESDVVEFFGKLGGTVGPASLTGSVFYAPKQTSLGRIYRNATEYASGVASNPKKWDNLYLSVDGAAAVPNTPVTLKAHVGYSNGNPGLGPNGTSLSPTGEYMDWSLGADFTYKVLTFNVSYIDTNITNRESAYLAPNFRDRKGDSISDPTVVFAVTAAF